MLLQVLPLKLTEGFALTMFKLLAKDVFMREVHYEMAAKYIPCILKPLQNKKGQKNLGYPRKSSPFVRKKTAFFSGTPNFFGPSYFEAALLNKEFQWYILSILCS